MLLLVNCGGICIRRDLSMSNVADTLSAAVGYIVTKDTFVDFVDLEHGSHKISI